MQIIWAETRDGFIGCDDMSLPWGNPVKEDMKWFREVTLGKHVIMGRNTWQSIGRQKLSGRLNHFILTRKKELLNQHPELFFSYDQIKSVKNAVVIGGLSVYNLFMDDTDTIYRTVMNGSFNESNKTVRAPVVDKSKFKLTRSYSSNPDLRFEIWSKI